jgi:hypothetical protein
MTVHPSHPALQCEFFGATVRIYMGIISDVEIIVDANT